VSSGFVLASSGSLGPYLIPPRSASETRSWSAEGCDHMFETKKDVWCWDEEGFKGKADIYTR
jgi:hypothetical protein